MPSEELMGYEEFKKTKFCYWAGDYLHAAFTMYFLDPKNEGLALSELEKMLKKEISMKAFNGLIEYGMRSRDIEQRKYTIIEGCMIPLFNLSDSFRKKLEGMLTDVSRRKKDPGITPASPA